MRIEVGLPTEERSLTVSRPCDRAVADRSSSFIHENNTEKLQSLCKTDFHFHS